MSLRLLNGVYLDDGRRPKMARRRASRLELLALHAWHTVLVALFVGLPVLLLFLLAPDAPRF